MGEAIGVAGRMRELQVEIERALDAQFAVVTWYSAGYWRARELQTDEPSLKGRGPTPVAALENLLAIAKKRQAPKPPRPHEEEWSIEQCIDWLEEWGEVSSWRLPGLEKKRVVVLWRSGADNVTKSLAAPWVDVYRSLVETTWLVLSEEGVV